MELACQVPKEKEMKKLFPVLILVLVMSGCGKVNEYVKYPGKVADRAYDIVDPAHLDNVVDEKIQMTKGAVLDVFSPSTGLIITFIALELNSNISSLVIDKTKEKITGFSSQVINELVPGSFFLVLPPRISNGESFVYDEDMGRLIRNYIAAGKFGVPVSNVADAEYIVVTSIRESLSKTYGVNYYEVSFSIHDKMDVPVYAASVRMESKSDRNFWYHATKKAKPVKKLTLKGLTHILAVGLPEANSGVIENIAAKVAKAEKKEN